MRVTADEAADALDEVLRDVFRARVVRKGDDDEPDPLSRGGFDDILRTIVRQLLAAASGPESAALVRIQQALDVDWSTLTEEGREHVIRRATAMLSGIPGSVTPKVRTVLEAVGRDVILGTKKFGRERFGIEITPSFHAVDRKVVQHAASSQALFIRDEYGRRSTTFSALARQVVSRGLEDGLDRYDIGRDLKTALTGTTAARSETYYRMVASVFAMRSRSYATLDGFTEAGIEVYEWSSVLDEQTSDICRFMDGRRFSVGAAHERFLRVAADDDPESVKSWQPFVSKGADEDGDYLYFKRGDSRVTIARIDESAVGQRDQKGTFSRGMSQQGLETAGVSSPPAHPHCRSLLVPG